MRGAFLMMLALIQKVAVASFIAALICGFFPSALQATIIDSGGGQFVWTELVTFSSPCQPSAVCQVGSIPGSPGSLIEIVNIAIGGDADATSGDAVFRLVGGGLDFTWTSGQSGTIATYDLGATPPTGPGSDRGFTYSGPISFFATEGTSLNIFFVAHFDFDGRFTNATDILGNVFKIGRASCR